MRMGAAGGREILGRIFSDLDRSLIFAWSPNFEAVCWCWASADDSWQMRNE